MAAVFLVTALLLGAALPVRAQVAGGSSLALSEQAVWDFAEALLSQGEYYRAVTEYERLRHFFPESSHARAAAVRIGEAHLYGGEARAAIDHFGALLGEAAFAPYRDEVLYLRGLGFLEAEGSRPYPLREASIALALRDFQAVASSSPRRAHLDAFAAALADTGDLPDKSPWLAGGLSALVPGAGSFYVGRYAEGSLALLVNALFIAATAEAFSRDDDDLGVVLGIGALAFYGGAIYAAANGAHKVNDRARADHLDRQRERFGLRFERGGVKGLLNLGF